MKADFKFSNLLGTVYRQGDLVFSRDGTQLLSPVGNRVSVFDLINNKSFTFEYEHRRDIATLDLNCQSTLLLSIDEDGRAILTNFKSRTVLHHFNFKEHCYRVKFSPDGKLFALACGRFLHIWKTPSTTEDRQFAPFVRYRVHAGHFQDIVSLTWSHDGRFILTSSKDLTARLWSVHSEDKQLASVTFAGHRDYVLGAFFSSDQEKIYTMGKDGALFQWEFTPKPGDEDEEEKEDEPDISKYSWRITQKHFCYNERNKVKCVTFHAPSNLLVIGFSNGEFRLYDLPHFTLLQQLSMGQNSVDTVSINSSGEWLAFGSSRLGQLLVYEWQSESYVLKQQGHFDSMNSLTYSPDGSRVVTASEDGKIKVWDVVSGFCLVTLEGHTSSVTQVQFAKRGQVLFSSSLDGTVRAWDLIRYRNFRVFTGAERIQFSCLAVDPSGEVVCAGSVDSFDIHVWSVQTGQLVDQLAGHEGPVSCLSFSQETGMLASASWDKTIRIWSVFGRSQQVEPIEVYSDVLALAARADGEQVAVSTLSGQISIFDIATARQVGSVDCRKDIIAGRNLEDRFTAKNSARSKFFTTISYSFDGLAIVAGGNNNSICLYDVANEVLLKRFIVSKNMNLNGTMEFLNSSRLTEAGSLDLIDTAGENSDLEDRIDNTVPGSNRGGDLSTRRVRPEVRVMSIQFSPTATAFAAASTEGLLVYSVDDTIVFDPFDLDVDVTPQTTLESLQNKSYLEALVMSFRLNEKYLISKIYESIPVSQINLVSSNLPVVYVSRILRFIAEYSMESQHIEFNLLWINAIISAHGAFMSLHKQDFSFALRSIQRFLGRVAKDVVRTSKTNKYAYTFLTSTDGNLESEAQIEGKLSEDDRDVDDDDDDEKMTTASEDEQEWLGFEAKVRQLPLNDGIESDQDDSLI
ncbi:PWP2 (YCR057C) [Zygosaccharomyces parabailii]|uniref:ZYBA0S11-00540g1_1 n=1 Tax=Zygosaccharomyces bailii (strain CLIB 213 / ATCC 58445 / CBS 680 / BCRC 21525 / NBRC 1098 / NCYC 1416 / NRRL Y-2227) TaxID=1333698 RepID=A0A8J2X4M4_ZYGB2|nr:PWP2 (YCR057C) [Zygosaccharomyces parabailii]CDF91337.1 ZYBA0S11-00540g1_1 [Zygosaccharomyces bailii CLIB 213]CDH17236.1 probable Periodic tryptophan protein 2 [Zygosaccharomyces bailii ISA1307]